MFNKVSVIIPVYNSAQYLRMCLESIIQQSLTDIEIICIDDGSTDNSSNILNEYALFDRRIKIIKQKNSDPAAARNTGLREATSEYVVFLDSDDWFEQDYLENAYRQIVDTESDICVSRGVKLLLPLTLCRP